MLVKNMRSNKGNSIPNQFIINDGHSEFFQSYSSVIVKVTPNQKTVLDIRYWNYSKNTSKYRNQFLGETSKEIKAKIKSGEYVLEDLNTVGVNAL